MYPDSTNRISMPPDTLACPLRLRPGLELLLDAMEYASDADVPVEEFAVDLASLRAVELTIVDLRWLVRKGYLKHLVEVAGDASACRCFRVEAPLSFADSACFHLTKSGMEFVSCVVNGEPPRIADPPVRSAQLPQWDAECRELRWAGAIVKRFRVPAPNQELILCAFQEDGWPPHIDDPLPQAYSIEPKRRLHDTIVALNRHREQPSIRFSGDGTGQGVRWQLTVVIR